MKLIKQIAAVGILIILSVSCSNIARSPVHNTENESLFSDVLSEKHAAGMKYLGTVNKVFSGDMDGRFVTGQKIRDFYGRTVVFEGHLVEYNIIKPEILDYVEKLEKNNALMHQHYKNVAYDKTKKYVEFSSYTDVKTGKVLCFELRVFFGNFLETFNESFWYAKSVTFNANFTKDINNNRYVDFGIPLVTEEDEDQLIFDLSARAEPANGQVRVFWNKTSLVKKVDISWWDENGEKREIITDGRTEITFTGLINYKNYYFKLRFFDKDDKELKKIWCSASPRSGNESEDFAQGPGDFRNENGYRFLKAGYKIWSDVDPERTVFSFEKTGDHYRVVFPGYLPEEDIFGYTEDDKAKFKDDPYLLMNRRFEKTLNYGENIPVECRNMNNDGGNVFWILYLADFFNLYKAEFPDTVDLSNAPDWFINLMTSRESGDNFIKTPEEVVIDLLYPVAEPGNAQVKVFWNGTEIIKKIVKKVDISWWDENGEKREIITDGRTEITFTGLINYKNYYFKLRFFDKDDKELKEMWCSASPRSGNESEDFAQGPGDFRNENGHRFLKAAYKIWSDVDPERTVFSFEKTGDHYRVIFPGYLSEEDVFGYTEDDKAKFKDDPYLLMNRRFEKTLNYGENIPVECRNMNNEDGNVFWILYLADFFNLYKTKLPDKAIDLSNAPAWFINLMNSRESGESYIRDTYK